MSLSQKPLSFKTNRDTASTGLLGGNRRRVLSKSACCCGIFMASAFVEIDMDFPQINNITITRLQITSSISGFGMKTTIVNEKERYVEDY